MLRRLWTSICVLLSFVSASVALTTSEVAVLFNRGIKPTYYANLLTGTLPSSLTFSRAGQATQYDSTGKLTYAPNNLLLNSATLSTQSITTVAGNYIISMYGTGSITLSGTATGTITGTGAANQVYLKVTATAGTLTLTVSGSVTSAVAAQVTYETAPRSQDQVITTSAAYYGPRFDYNPNTLAPLGLLIEGSATNYLFNSSDLGNASYVKAGSVAAAPTVTSNAAISPNGTTTAASVVFPAVTSGYSLVYQPIPTTATPWDNSIFLKGSVGGEQIYIYLTYATTVWFRNRVTLTTSWQRFDVTGTPAANWYWVLGTDLRDPGSTSTSAITIYAWGGQSEANGLATSYTPTAASTVTRAADIVQFTGGALTTLQGAQGAVIVQKVSEGATNPAANTNILKGTNSILYRDTTGKLGTTNGTTALLTSGTPTWTSVNRVGLSWSPGNRLLNYTAATAANDNNSAANGGTIYLGSNNGSNAENGWYQSFGIYNQTLTNQQLQAKSTVGAPY